MKQVIQNYRTGELKVEEVPYPLVRKEGILVKTSASLISAGTERTKIETAQMNLIEKAISRLDLVKIVLNNIKQEGIFFTLKKALNKLDTPISLGYSCAGEVIEVGKEVSEFKIGDRVACVGENYAAHSEINSVPKDFAMIIPEKVDFDEASFVGLGAIALNSVVISQPREDENVVVIGLGLLGQIVVQVLKSFNCRVMGVEIDDEKIALAQSFGVDACANPLKDDIESLAKNFTGGKGADMVIITAASRNNLPIELAGKIARNKGRVILVGAMPIIIPRKEYYEKELLFMISRGFGADLYYPIEKGRDYSFNYRPVSAWENMKNFLDLLCRDKVNIKPLITHRFNITEAPKAYELIRTSRKKYLGILFTYNNEVSLTKKVQNTLKIKTTSNLINIGFIGAGSFAQGYILPALKKQNGVNLTGVATSSGVSAASAARKFGFSYSTTDYNQILQDATVNTVFILTRHNLHGKIIVEALKHGKNVFVEKPLCLTENELKEIISTHHSQITADHSPILMVGFNRRFSPFIVAMKDFFKNRTSPLIMNYRVNAGYLPPNHWTHDLKEGGGRILGEVCHFVDLLQYISEALPVEVSTIALNHPDKTIPPEDNVLVTIKFSDNSLGTINYNSVGDPAFPRERIEVFGANSATVIDNFTKGIFSRSGVIRKISKMARDMGHNEEIRVFVRSLKEKTPSPIPFNELVTSTLATFKIQESLEERMPVKVEIERWLR